MVAVSGESETINQNGSGDTDQPSQTLGSADSTAELPVSSNSGLGPVWVPASDQRTLYTFQDDQPGVTNCTGSCTNNWPPAQAPASTSQADASLSTLERPDQTLQWTFKGFPLYFYTGDAASGEVNGEGLADKWYVARPDPFRVVEHPDYPGGILAGNGSINGGIGDASIRRSDLDGLTLYIFTRDSSGQSNCNVGCAEDWPPLYADIGAVAENGFTLITRIDGAAQWAYNGSPLYFYIGDSAAGDVTGDGVGSEWFVARP